ncbi:peptidoglycan DD-metalloendopeptidase family protein [Pseudooceanicola sp. C21-150M6]|uniref:peptidoglycan DD-metalloendopeptidase family protein n=1 Tax=Pseudooceanicola sp. C21-150M6 TaxID=3434355 RepID=UPI003D7F3FA8
MQETGNAGLYGRARRGLMLGTAALALAACQNGLDIDLRGGLGGFSTAEAARQATLDRPKPDDRGIISYPTYQVAVAKRADTVSSVAARVGVTADDLARFNGLTPESRLREGELLAMPQRVAEPSPATGANGLGPIQPAGEVDISTLAGSAIERAGDQSVAVTELAPAATTPSSAVSAKPMIGTEPVRHKVKRGETAFTISRLYNVSVRALADWNGLDSEFSIREGQYLLIPVADQSAPVQRVAAETEPPGSGTPTPLPPSASTPLPDEKTEPLVAAAPAPAAGTGETAAAPSPAPAPAPSVAPSLGDEQTPAPSSAAMDFPVRGNIIREFSRGSSDGINIAADPGTAVRAADGGTVAAITSDADNKKVIVVRHSGGLLTIYSNIDAIAVSEGAAVSRGQKIAEIRAGASPYVHFEVRKGLEAVDPMTYLQ